jgi:hypothetical protein
MGPVHSINLRQPNHRIRHRRNLQQLPQVMCLAMQPRPFAAFVGATRGTRVAMGPVSPAHIRRQIDAVFAE